MHKFQNKYRIPSARLEGWDYSAAGAYFITICTLEKHHLFGKIARGKMHLSPAGEQAAQHWDSIPEKFPNARLDAFVVMPNHIHGLLLLQSEQPAVLEKQSLQIPNPLETVLGLAGGCTGMHNPMFANGIGRILRWYKGRCTFEIRKTNSCFCWQERYWETIIWTEKALENIRNYIQTNVQRWANDPHRN